MRSDGRVVLAGDSDLTATDRASWIGPWRYEALTAARGATCLVLGPAGAPLRRVADAVDAAVPAVSAVWGTDWNRNVAVLVTGSDTAFAAAVGSPELLEDVAAAAVTDGVDPVSHRPYGQRLVLAPSAVAELTAVGTGIVVRHELTHLAAAAVTDPTTPRWIVEGFAEYVANLGSGQSVADGRVRTARRGRGRARRRRCPPTPRSRRRATPGERVRAGVAGLPADRAGGSPEELVRFYRTAAGCAPCRRRRIGRGGAPGLRGAMRHVTQAVAFSHAGGGSYTEVASCR